MVLYVNFPLNAYNIIIKNKKYICCIIYNMNGRIIKQILFKSFSTISNEKRKFLVVMRQDSHNRKLTPLLSII